MKAAKIVSLLWATLGFIGVICVSRAMVEAITDIATHKSAGPIFPLLVALITCCALSVGGYASFKSKFWARWVMLIVHPCIILWASSLAMFYLWRGNHSGWFYALVCIGIVSLGDFVHHLLSRHNRQTESR